MEKIAYQGQFIRVTEEIIADNMYERAYLKSSVTILALTEDHRILFIKEKRPHEKPTERWKLVTGFYEDGQNLMQNVNRELQEEIGKKALSVTPYLTIHSSGTLVQTQYLALARDLIDSKLPNPDGEDTILAIQSLSLEETLARTLSGEFSRGMTGYALLRLYYDVQNGNIIL